MKTPKSRPQNQYRVFTRGINPAKTFSLSRIERNTDKTLIRRVTLLTRRLNRVLSKAAPNTSDYTRSGMAVDLADLWHAGEELRKCLRELLSLKFPKDRERFRTLIILIDPLLTRHFEWHIRQLKKRRKAILRAGRI